MLPELEDLLTALRALNLCHSFFSLFMLLYTCDLWFVYMLPIWVQFMLSMVKIQLNENIYRLVVQYSFFYPVLALSVSHSCWICSEGYLLIQSQVLCSV